MRIVVFCLLVGIQVAWTQMHHRCPLACKCDFEGSYKRVRCEVPDSATNINFNDIDSDIHFLEVLPKKRGRTDAFGPTLPDAFADFPNLQRLIIRNNGIQRISASTARQLPALDTLDLVGNDIRSIRDLSIDNFPGLIILQLSSNDIDSVTDDSFRALKELKLLALNSNAMRSVSANAFQNQQYLEHLELRGNQLTDLPSSIFDNIVRLNYFDLRSNQLSAVPRGVQRLLSLVVLLLDDNKITTIPNTLVQAWRSSDVLSDVSLYDNPIICDDSLNDFIAWTKTSDGFKKTCDITSVRGAQASSGRAKCPTCGRPRAAAGKTVDTVSSHDFSMQGDQGGRPGTDDGYSVYRVVDDSRAPASFNPKRDSSRPASNSRADQTIAKLRQYMPGAGVRCGQQSCYYFSAKGTREWQTAEYNCQSVGLDLVEISSAAEQKIVMQFLIEAVKENSQRTSPSRGWWIGFRYDPRSNSVISATTGRPVSYNNFAPGQPNNFATAEECLELWDTGDWNDGRCTLPMANQYICESPLTVGQGINVQNNALSSGGRRSVSVSGSSAKSGMSSYDTVSFSVLN